MQGPRGMFGAEGAARPRSMSRSMSMAEPQAHAHDSGSDDDHVPIAVTVASGTAAPRLARAASKAAYASEIPGSPAFRGRLRAHETEAGIGTPGRGGGYDGGRGDRNAFMRRIMQRSAMLEEDKEFVGIRARRLASLAGSDFSHDSLRRLFRLLDSDNSHEVSAVEIQKGLVALGFEQCMNPTVLSRLLLDIDEDRTGTITEGEFLSYFASMSRDELHHRLDEYNSHEMVCKATLYGGRKVATLVTTHNIPTLSAHGFVATIDTLLNSGASPENTRLWLDIQGYNPEIYAAMCERFGLDLSVTTDALIFQAPKLDLSAGLPFDDEGGGGSGDESGGRRSVGSHEGLSDEELEFVSDVEGGSVAGGSEGRRKKQAAASSEDEGAAGARRARAAAASVSRPGSQGQGAGAGRGMTRGRSSPSLAAMRGGGRQNGGSPVRSFCVSVAKGSSAGKPTNNPSDRALIVLHGMALIHPPIHEKHSIRDFFTGIGSTVAGLTEAAGLPLPADIWRKLKELRTKLRRGSKSPARTRSWVAPKKKESTSRTSGGSRRELALVSKRQIARNPPDISMDQLAIIVVDDRVLITLRAGAPKDDVALAKQRQVAEQKAEIGMRGKHMSSSTQQLNQQASRRSLRAYMTELSTGGGGMGGEDDEDERFQTSSAYSSYGGPGPRGAGSTFVSSPRVFPAPQESPRARSAPPGPGVGGLQASPGSDGGGVAALGVVSGFEKDPEEPPLVDLTAVPAGTRKSFFTGIAESLRGGSTPRSSMRLGAASVPPTHRRSVVGRLLGIPPSALPAVTGTDSRRASIASSVYSDGLSGAVNPNSSRTTTMVPRGVDPAALRGRPVSGMPSEFSLFDPYSRSGAKAGQQDDGSSEISLILSHVRARLGAGGASTAHLLGTGVSIKCLAMELVDAVLQHNFSIRDALKDWEDLLFEAVQSTPSSAHTPHLFALDRLATIYLRALGPLQMALDPRNWDGGGADIDIDEQIEAARTEAAERARAAREVGGLLGLGSFVPPGSSAMGYGGGDDEPAVIVIDDDGGAGSGDMQGPDALLASVSAKLNETLWRPPRSFRYESRHETEDLNIAHATNASALQRFSSSFRARTLPVSGGAAGVGVGVALRGGGVRKAPILVAYPFTPIVHTGQVPAEGLTGEALRLVSLAPSSTAPVPVRYAAPLPAFPPASALPTLRHPNPVSWWAGTSADNTAGAAAAAAANAKASSQIAAIKERRRRASTWRGTYHGSVAGRLPALTNGPAGSPTSAPSSGGASSTVAPAPATAEGDGANPPLRSAFAGSRRQAQGAGGAQPAAARGPRGPVSPAHVPPAAPPANNTSTSVITSAAGKVPTLDLTSVACDTVRATDSGATTGDAGSTTAGSGATPTTGSSSMLPPITTPTTAPPPLAGLEALVGATPTTSAAPTERSPAQLEMIIRNASRGQLATTAEPKATPAKAEGAGALPGQVASTASSPVGGEGSAVPGQVLSLGSDTASDGAFVPPRSPVMSMSRGRKLSITGADGVTRATSPSVVVLPPLEHPLHPTRSASPTATVLPAVAAPPAPPTAPSSSAPAPAAAALPEDGGGESPVPLKLPPQVAAAEAPPAAALTSPTGDRRRSARLDGPPVRALAESGSSARQAMRQFGSKNATNFGGASANAMAASAAGAAPAPGGSGSTAAMLVQSGLVLGGTPAPGGATTARGKSANTLKTSSRNAAAAAASVGTVGGGAAAAAAAAVGTVGGTVAATAAAPGVASAAPVAGVDAAAAAVGLAAGVVVPAPGNAIDASTAVRFFRSQLAEFLELADDLDAMCGDLLRTRQTVTKLQSQLSTLQSDAMNRILYMLTLITALALPVSFFTGYWGTNFTDQAELDPDNVPFGGIRLFWTCVASALGLILFIFWRARFFDML